MKKSFFEKYKTSEVTNTRRVICTPGSFTREHFFYIQEAGYLKSLQPHLSRRSGLSSYLFLLILSGSGTVSYNPKPNRSSSLQTAAAKAGDCFFLDCSNEYTHISSGDDPWELLWIHFYGPQAAGYYSYFTEHHHWHFQSPHFNDLAADITAILEMHEHRTDDTDILVADRIIHILTDICASSSNPSDEPASKLSKKLHDVTEYLDAHYTETLSLDDLSTRFYISKYYLSREFKKEHGITIVQYLLTKKITHAKELLRYSNSSIEDIAVLCGIDDASYFNKVFKKLEGCTASEYRKRW